MRNVGVIFRPPRMFLHLLSFCISSAGGFASGELNSCLWLDKSAFCISSGAQIESPSQGLQRHHLENGMVCIIREDFSAPLVSIQVWVRAGSAQEEEYCGGGLSHLIEHMLFKGTRQRRPSDIAKEIDDVGGSINAYTTLDRTVFWVDMPCEHWQKGLEVLADAVTQASFPVNEWRREKDVVRREMAMNNDNPERVLSKLLFGTAYRVHPYRFPVIGREDIFNTLARDDLIAFFRANYTPHNMIIVLVGSLSAQEACSAVENRFHFTSRRARLWPASIEEPPQLSPRAARKTGLYNISRLAFAWHTVSLSHPDAPALDILAVIAGGLDSSRLNQKIKEGLKLAFSIDAWSFTPKDEGLFGINATFDPAKEEELIKAIEAEVGAWRTNSFTEAEVDKARNKITADTLLSFQTMHGQADTFASGEFYARTPLYFDTYLKRLSALTPQSLTAVANTYLHDQNRTLVILSPSLTNISNVRLDHTKDVIGIPRYARNDPPATLGSALRAGKQPTPAAGTDIVKTVFPNGLTLLAREDNRLPFVHICVASLGGLLLEDDENNGITCLMAELLRRGTETRSQEEIADRIESSGGSISSFSGLNSCGMLARCFSAQAELFMDIIADCYLKSVFPGDEIVKCKAIQVSMIERQRESPFFLAQEAMRKMLFAEGHPFRLNMEGTPETVMAVTREDLLHLHRKIAVGSNTVIAVFGNISVLKAKELTEKFMGKISAGQRQDMQKSAARPEAHGLSVRLPRALRALRWPGTRGGNDKKRLIELTAPREQTIVLAGFPGLSVTDHRIDALNLLLQALSGLSSDLMINVRDKKGLVYYTGAYHKTGMAGGQFVVYAGTREEVCAQVRELIEREIARLAEKGIRADEFERARLQIISQGRQSRQDNLAFAQECALNELYGLGYGYGLETEKRLAQLALHDARQVAAEIMRREKMVTVIVKPDLKRNAE